ncbi:MAG: outer membrane protein OmpA-like peptidoglycan-associated protein [Shewanella psychromarinicola]|jgi:outer membrane protein OmpA-like peptidoglycan-associated protein|uniref:OmpA family protein n=1 Tax=Shewanella psychromarinicola TaxID=2487742 RepID=UPI003EEA77FC
MAEKLIMTNSLINKTITVKRAFGIGLTMLLITACAGKPLQVMEAQVEQLKNLQDYDSDGVIEAREKCADTVLGATINNVGCGTQTTYVEPLNVDIKFANNSYSIPPSAISEIQSLAKFLEKRPELRVIIEGHTSKVGAAELNKILSAERAKSVASLLVNDFNITPERVSSIGYGFEKLADFADNEEAHATNRRILAEFNETVIVDDMKWTIYTVD